MGHVNVPQLHGNAATDLVKVGLNHLITFHFLALLAQGEIWGELHPHAVTPVTRLLHCAVFGDELHSSLLGLPDWTDFPFGF
jgi:hypothetical protein